MKPLLGAACPQGRRREQHHDARGQADDKVLLRAVARLCAHATLVGRQVASASTVAPSSARWRTTAALTSATS